MGEDSLKNLDPIHLVKELRSTLTQPKMLNLYLVAAGYIETIKELWNLWNQEVSVCWKCASTN